MFNDSVNIKSIKSDIIKSFASLLKNNDIEIRFFKNNLLVYCWSKPNVSDTIKFNYFKYFIPHFLNVSYYTNGVNKLEGLNFEFKDVSRQVVLTQLKIFYNLIKGLLKPYEIIIQIFGTGFKFILVKDDIYNYYKLIIHSGFNKPKSLIVPIGIQATTIDATTIKLVSINKQQLTNFGSLIKNIKPINKYKLRGIKYENDLFVKRTYKKTK